MGILPIKIQEPYVLVKRFYRTFYVCRRCHGKFWIEYLTFCPNCGQGKPLLIRRRKRFTELTELGKELRKNGASQPFVKIVSSEFQLMRGLNVPLRNIIQVTQKLGTREHLSVADVRAVLHNSRSGALYYLHCLECLQRISQKKDVDPAVFKRIQSRPLQNIVRLFDDDASILVNQLRRKSTCGRRTVRRYLHCKEILRSILQPSESRQSE